MDFYALVQQCSPHINPKVAAAIVHTESRFNPFAIGVVGGAVKQPTNINTAVQAVRELSKAGANYSVGIAQINQSNFAKYGLNESNMFDPCSNLRVGASIFNDCLNLAAKTYPKTTYDGKLRLAASCYYSGNFKGGFRQDFAGQPPYVAKFYKHLNLYRGASRFNEAKINEPIRPQQPFALPMPQATTVTWTTASVPKSPTTVQPDESTTLAANPYTAILAQINAQKAQLATQTPNESLQVAEVKPIQRWDIFNDF